MNIKYVIDSSTLISLAKIGKLELLNKIGFELYSLHEVFIETVHGSLLHGETEGVEIQKLFDLKIIHQEKTSGEQIKGISGNDAKVIRLAEKLHAGVLANDTLLGRKANLQGIISLGSADLLLLAKEKDILSETEFRSKIKELIEKNRLSAKTAAKYLRGD